MFLCKIVVVIFTQYFVWKKVCVKLKCTIQFHSVDLKMYLKLRGYLSFV